MSDPVTAVWFDLDGTLIQYEQSFPAIFEHAIGAGSPAVRETFTTALFAAIEAAKPTPYRAAFVTAVEETALTGDPEELAGAYIDAEVAATTVPATTERVLTTVGDTGPVGVLTNGAGRVQRRKLAAHGLAELVDATVISGEERIGQPDPALFDRAASQVDAAHHIYVGDTPAEDVVGATRAGWTPILFGDGSAATADATTAAATVQTFAAIPPVVDELRDA